jgi:hypothetical protein
VVGNREETQRTKKAPAVRRGFFFSSRKNNNAERQADHETDLSFGVVSFSWYHEPRFSDFGILFQNGMFAEKAARYVSGVQ